MKDTVIRTSSDGLVAGPVSVPVAGFAMPAYRAMPEGAGPWPILLVVSEIFGVHDHIADVCRRFARLGCFAIAAELFVRHGDAKSIDDIPTLMSTIVSKVPDAQALGDLDACVAWAARMGGDVQRLGVTGFCWGGRMTWLYCAHNPAVRAGVAWYGRLVGETNERQTAMPVDVASRLAAPVLGLYGGDDAGIPLAWVETMKAALAKGSDAAKRSSIVVYPGAKHAFHADYRPNYDVHAATDGWRRCIAFLRENGVA